MGALLLSLVILASVTPTFLSVLDSPSPSPAPQSRSAVPRSRSPISLTSRATALFVLGDSSVNCGDNVITNLFLPHNISSSALLAGSSRRLLPDFIAEKMGLPSLPAFYGSNWTQAALASGVNFGSTPATILSAITSASSPVAAAGSELFLFQTLNQQVRQVYETLQILHLEIGPAAGRRVATSMFLLSFGRDDYVDILSKSISDYPMYGRRGLSRLLVSQMIQAIKDLYNAGARRIAVMGVEPLGCAPRVRWMAARELQGKLCVDDSNEIVHGYNMLLKVGLRELDRELVGARIVFCDVYAGIMEIISNPGIYGFVNVRDACCGAGLFGGMIGCLAKGMACGNPWSHVWWDLYSTTEAVDALLANWSWSSTFPTADHQICTPLNLRQLSSH